MLGFSGIRQCGCHFQPTEYPLSLPPLWWLIKIQKRGLSRTSDWFVWSGLLYKRGLLLTGLPPTCQTQVFLWPLTIISPYLPD